MLYKELDFDDYRCRNIFVSIVQEKLPEAKVYHKSHTSYGKVYLEVPDQPQAENLFSQAQEEYEETRQKFLKSIGPFLEKMIDNTPIEEEDLSGDDYVKINFPSPYSFLFLRAILKRKNIELKDHFTSSTAIVGVHDEKTFNDKFWKGRLKPLIERLEKKIDHLANPYLEEPND